MINLLVKIECGKSVDVNVEVNEERTGRTKELMKLEFYNQFKMGVADKCAT